MLFNLFGRWSEEPSWRLSPSTYSRENMNNYGGKVLLPQSVLEDLVILQVQPPYIFEISHIDKSIVTHCGVLEFTADECNVVVPRWMYEQLSMDMISEVEIKYKSVPLGSFVKLLPHSTNFLEIENPKRELESSLRNYQVLTLGDEILCTFEEFEPIRFSVVKIEPEDADAVYIVDTDLSVDFCEPLGYKEKVESEKTVNKYLEILESEHEIKPIRMKKVGLTFNIPKDL